MNILERIDKYLGEADDPKARQKEIIKNKIAALRDDIVDLDSETKGLPYKDDEYQKMKKIKIRKRIEVLQKQLGSIK